MAHSGNTISAPVRIIQDLCPVLGTEYEKIGQIVRYANIREWAKNKPVRLNKITALTATERATAKYGMYAPYASGTAPYNLINLYDGGMNGWEYRRPRGIANEEWYRERDFDGYTHAPNNPVRSYSPADSVIYDTEPFADFQAAGFLASVDAAGLSIELTEIATIIGATSNLYFGVALFQGTNLTPTTAMSARTEIATSTGAIAKNLQGYSGTTVSFNKSRMTINDKGLWTIIPFFTLGQITQCGAWENTPLPGGKVFYPVPYANISLLDVQSYQDFYTIRFNGTNTGVYISTEITITNNGNASREFVLSCYFWDSAVSGTPDTRARQSYELQFDLTVTIAARASYTWNVPPTFTREDSRLISGGVGYIRVSGESTCRGPFNFKRVEPSI